MLLREYGGQETWRGRPPRKQAPVRVWHEERVSGRTHEGCVTGVTEERRLFVFYLLNCWIFFFYHVCILPLQKIKFKK